MDAGDSSQTERSSSSQRSAGVADGMQTANLAASISETLQSEVPQGQEGVKDIELAESSGAKLPTYVICKQQGKLKLSYTCNSEIST